MLHTYYIKDIYIGGTSIQAYTLIIFLGYMSKCGIDNS